MDQHIDRLWELALHEDSQFDSRLQVFLTAHALMLTAAGFVLSKATPSKVFLSAVALFGLIMGTVWFLVQTRIAGTIQRLEQLLDTHDPAFKIIYPPRPNHKGIKWLGQATIISNVLPVTVTIGWLLLGIWTVISL